MDKVRTDVQGGMAQVGQASAGQAKAAGDKAGKGFKEGFAAPMKGLGAGLKKAMVPALAGLALVAAGAKKSVDAASDLSEQINKTGVVFKESAPGLIEWSKTAATAMGQSQRQALEATGTFGNMLVPMGFARKEAAKMSKGMVQLGSDMASFNNASPEETLDALRAGLAGETEPLRRFGVFLSQARIQQEALSLGLIKGADTAKVTQAALATATTAAAAATRAHEAAVQKLAAAHLSVTAAQKQVKATTEALSASEDRAKAAAERVTQAEDRQKKTSDVLRNAKQALKAAQDNARSSQDALTDARKRATEQIISLREATQDAQLSEERASIGLARAQERVTEVMADSESTDLDKREAILSLREAERGLQEAQDKRAGIATDLADAEKKGIEGADDVVAAKLAAAKADSEADKASKAVTAAQTAYAKAQDKVRSSLKNLTAAQEELRVSRTSASAATHRLAVAQERLTVAEARSKSTAETAKNATKALTEAKAAAKKASSAMTKQLTAEQKAQATYSIIMKDTKDAQGDFARTSDGVANKQRIVKAQMEDTAAAMGKSLLPAMQDLLGVMQKFFGLITKNQGATKALIIGATALAGAIVAINIGMKIYAAGAAVVKAATAAWTAVQWLLDASFAPMLLIPIALAAIAVGLVIAYKKSETFREIVDKLFGAIVDGAKWIIDFFKNNWEYVIAGIILGPFGLVLVGIIKHWDDIKAAVKAGVDAVIGVLGDVVGKLTSAALKVGKAIYNGVVGAVTGVANAVWSILQNIGDIITRKAGDIVAWGAKVGGWLKDAVINAATGIASGVWAIVARIGDRFAEGIATVKAWGAAVGGWLKDALIEGVKGVALGVWDKLSGAAGGMWKFLQDNQATVEGWGRQVGKWLRDAIVDGLSGLGGLIKDAVKKAIRGLGGKLGGAVGAATGIFKKAAPSGNAWMPGPMAAPLGPTAGLLAGPSTGAVAGAPPPLYNLRQLMTAMQEPEAAPPSLEVRVFIGDTELKGIVRTEVRKVDDATARTLLAASSRVA